MSSSISRVPADRRSTVRLANRNPAGSTTLSSACCTEQGRWRSDPHRCFEPHPHSAIPRPHHHIANDKNKGASGPIRRKVRQHGFRSTERALNQVLFTAELKTRSAIVGHTAASPLIQFILKRVCFPLDLRAATSLFPFALPLLSFPLSFLSFARAKALV